MGSRSSTKSTKSGTSTSRMEDGKVMEPGPGSGSVPAVQKEKQAQPQTSTTHRSAGSYFPSVRPASPLACHNDCTTPADVVPPSPPTLAQHNAQLKKVLKREELVKEVRNLRYNDLVEG